MRNNDGAMAVAAGFLGWTLDAFDFFLVILCLKDIGKSFQATDTQMALCTSLTLFMRPLGALIFGLLADRYGRRRPLMINLVFYSTLSILSGFAPNFSTFLVCRIFFGIGMGGEWGVGASLAMEKVSPKWRGLLSGLLQEGYAMGNLLASAAYFAIFPHFGWRPLFLIGGLPALLALFIRSHVRESEIWEQSRASSWHSLGAAIVSHWRVFVAILLLMFMMNLSSHGTQDMFPSMLKEQWHFSARQVAAINAIASVGRDRRRRGGRDAFRPHRPTRGNDRLVCRGDLRHSTVGVRTDGYSAGARCLLDAIFRARRVGRDPSPHHGIVARFGARFSARVWLSMCRGCRRQHRTVAIGIEAAHVTGQCDGPYRAAGLRRSDHRHRHRPRMSRGPVWR